MKTFKEHITEAFSTGGMPVVHQQWQDQDAMPSAETAIEALNAFVGAIGEHEYMNPKLAIKKIQENLSRLGYHFDMPTIDAAGGEYSTPLSFGAGSFEVNRDENPLGEFAEGDGISEHIPGGVSLSIDVMASGDGKSLMNAQIVRNTEKEKATPVDKIAVKPVA